MTLKKIKNKFKELEAKAEKIYGINNFPYKIVIEPRNSSTIGSFSWMYGVNHYDFFFNALYIATNSEKDINDVIVHEFCHFLTLKLHGYVSRPHGKEWRKIMKEFGEIEQPRATTRIKNRAKVLYSCGCTFLSKKPEIKKCCDCGKKIKKQ